MRTPTSASMAFAACGLLTMSLMASAQTWVETHPAQSATKGASPAQNAALAKQGTEIRAAQYEERLLRPDNGDEDQNRDNQVDRERGSLDHPDNAGGESNRHE